MTIRILLKRRKGGRGYGITAALSSMIQERIMEGGMVRIPESFLKKLKLQYGDKVIFTEDPRGNVIIANSSLDILPTLECGFWGIGPKVGIENERDIVRFVSEFRRERDE